MFDLETDPHELRNVGRSQVLEHKKVRTRMAAALLTWATKHHTRITATKEVLNRQGIAAELGILIGFWDEAEFEATTGMPFSSLVPAGPPEG